MSDADRPAARLDPVLLADLRTRLGATPGRVPDAGLVTAVARGHGVWVAPAEATVLAAAARAETTGAGLLQAVLDEPGVTDVLVNGARSVWVDRGRGLERVSVDLGDDSRVRALAVRLAAAGGRRLDDASPAVDARLPDGTRLHAVLPPLAEPGPLLSLRTVRPRAFPLAELVACGTVPAALEPLLRRLVAHRANLLVTGGTGSGKTTLLATLLSLVPPDQRVVCIEEAGELNPDHPHVVRLVERPPNVEGMGAVGAADLVRHALRMRPDRIVLGECRGPEVREVMAALNTGHEGSCATLHASTARDVPARLEALGALAGLDAIAVAAQAAGAFDVVLHLRRDGGGRRLTEVGLVDRDEAGRLRVRPAARTLGAPGGGARVVAGPAWAELEARWGGHAGQDGAAGRDG